MRLLTRVADADHGHLGHTRQQQNCGDAKLLLGLFKGVSQVSLALRVVLEAWSWGVWSAVVVGDADTRAHSAEASLSR